MQISGGRILFQVALLGVLFACPVLSQARKGGDKLKCPAGGSFGVLNKRAIEMPPPIYPKEAKERGITGGVAVFVIVDKRGMVREARACSGPRELRVAAEEAAFRARFRPTILSGKAVENRGVLTYAFPQRGRVVTRSPRLTSSLKCNTD
jgi:TonB family protein